MTSLVEDLMRPASLAQLGGFRPPEDPLASWAGRVRVGGAGETWPLLDGAPMLGLLQLNLTEAPVLPPCLNGLALLTLFMRADDGLPLGDPNGTTWELRAHADLATLVAIDEPAVTREHDPKARRGAQPGLKPLPIRWSEVADHPSRDDIPFDRLDEYDELSEEYDDDDAPRPHDGLKLGGWPVCIQSEVGWDGLDGVQFALQVDGLERVGFSAGDGVLYFGRRCVAGQDTWHVDCQFM